jgi:glycosyltransferase involved in cell wall biosynthesis
MKEGGHPCTVVDMRRRFSLSALFLLARTIKEHGIDVVHTHGFRANLYGRLASLWTGVETISTVHVSLFDYVDTPSPIRSFYILLEKGLSFKTRTFLCISRAMAKDTLRLGINKRKIVLIPNGVDLKRFHPRPAKTEQKREMGITTDGPLVGTVGRMVTEKGQIHLVEAVKHLNHKWKDLKCLFVGEGPMLPRLKRRAAELGVAHMCVFAGIRLDIEFIYPLLDIFVLPSLREPFGLVLLEAMASGVPVIATASGGPLEFIHPDANGALVPPANAEALASKISALLSNRNQTKAMATEGRRMVEHEFSIRETVKRVENVYSSFQSSSTSTTPGRL